MEKETCCMCESEITKEDIDNGNTLSTGKDIFGCDIVPPQHDICPEVNEES